MEWWEAFKEWFLNLGSKYNVNPLIFGSIYIGAIPFFLLCLRWTVRNIRRKKPFTLPFLLTAFCFVSSYLYLIIAGKNIPVLVYIFIALMIRYGGYPVIRKIRNKVLTNDS